MLQTLTEKLGEVMRKAAWLSQPCNLAYCGSISSQTPQTKYNSTFQPQLPELNSTKNQKASDGHSRKHQKVLEGMLGCSERVFPAQDAALGTMARQGGPARVPQCLCCGMTQLWLLLTTPSPALS